MADFYLEPRHADTVILSVLQANRWLLPSSSNPAVEERAGGWTPPDGYKTFDFEVSDGTAIIPVRGGLVSAQIPQWWWHGNLTYESLVNTIDEAMAHSDVERVLLNIYSPGGTVTGCAEAVEKLNRLSAQKPLIAHCSLAASAAYWLASAANEIIVDPTGEVGSIGVIMMHVDISEALKKFGIDVTLIFSGAHKGDGWPFNPLSEEALGRFQDDVDYLRELFVAGVASNRALSEQSVRDTEALTYKGQQGVDAGLADSVAFLSDTITNLAGVGFQPSAAGATATRHPKGDHHGKAKSGKTNALATRGGRQKKAIQGPKRRG
jgi:signal peptide peptidase SppA